MAASDLLAIIREKQAQIARLRTELAQAQVLLAKIVSEGALSGVRRGRWRRRSAKMIVHSPTAHEAVARARQLGLL